jgi:2-oxoglutarate/2-oxoacid ferredoxin oxidoreductase subunit beta
MIEASLAELPAMEGPVAENVRKEYGRHYRKLIADRGPAAELLKIEAVYDAPQSGRREVVLLGSAGQRIITAGEILCLAGLTAGLNTTQKNEYNITVLRGHSISELILSPEEIDYTGIKQPGVVLALAQEGVDRRKDMFNHLDNDAIVLKADGVEVPACSARIHPMDLKSRGIKKPDWALASLGVLAGLGKILSPEMLAAALKIRFKGGTLDTSLELVKKVGG